MIKLNEREKKIVGGGGAFLLIFLLYGLIISPAMSKYEGIGRKIEQKGKELEEVRKLQKEYLEGKEKLKNFESILSQSEASFSLFSFLESLADKENIRENIASMKPKNVPINETYSESSVEIKIDRISLKQLTNYLFQIENSDHFLTIKKIRMKTRYDNPAYLDVTFTVSTLELI